jgi:hypothetical protein
MLPFQLLIDLLGVYLPHSGYISTVRRGNTTLSLYVLFRNFTDRLCGSFKLSSVLLSY